MQEYIALDSGNYTVQMSANPQGETNFVSLVDANTFTVDERNKLQYTNELDSNQDPIEAQAYLDAIKETDILDFVGKYKTVESIKEHIECCTGNAAKQGCSQEDKDLIDLQKVDFETKLIPAEASRATQLAYLKTTYASEETDIISQINDHLIGNG